MLNGSFQFLLNLKFLKKSYTWDTALRGLSLKGEENGKFRMKIIIKHSTQTSVLDTELSCLFDVVHLFVDLYAVVPWFKIDDVYIGMLAEKEGVKAKYMCKFHNKEPPINVNCLNVKKPDDILAWHGVTGKCLFEVFQATLDLI